MKIASSALFRWWPLRRRATPASAPRDRAEPSDRAQLEGRVQTALQPVEPPTGFRETLRENLRVAARQRQTGLRVEYPKPIRELVLLTLSMGVVVATITTVLLRRRN